MEFTTDKPIYRQIADYCCEQVLTGAWPSGGKVPSVRELALDMAVNTHTVLKAYDQLQADGIIAPRRGMGYYAADDAPANFRTAKTRFLRRNSTCAQAAARFTRHFVGRTA